MTKKVSFNAVVNGVGVENRSVAGVGEKERNKQSKNTTSKPTPAARDASERRARSSGALAYSPGELQQQIAVARRQVVAQERVR